jgi:hypothetical protein
MKIVDIIKAAWGLFNGKKLNTGSVVILLTVVFEQLFAQFGVTHDSAVQMATYIVMGAGAVIMVVGYVHRWIKSLKKPVTK